ncbi:MAG: CBS domain-containing protein [Candidatus Diapherotrites archaeon]|nr:CBS domain-containing protein [Candidatus Diapherotrites archaeon]
MLVKEVMTKKPITVKENDFILDVIKLFKKHRIRGAPVVKKGKLVGLITEKHILDFMEVHDFGSRLVLPAPFDFIEAVIDAHAEVYEVEREFNKLKHGYVKDLMDKNPVTVTPDTHVSEAADIMTEKGITHLPVVEKGKLVGLVTRTDLLKSLV